jgi:outer membrane protein TolC
MTNKLVFIVSLCTVFASFSQENKTILTLEEYIGYVKKFHPIVKQARLITSESEAQLLKSRGAFDPKIEVDYDRKKFKNTSYYDKLNAMFKIPTWYGVELKANYENNEGSFLNPELSTPSDGLYSAGISISLAKGLLTNERMATLQQAKLYLKQAKAAQDLLVNDILYNAITSYFNWLKNKQSTTIYGEYVENATIRLSNVKQSFIAGDKPAIDTLEASINLKNRLLDFEKARIGYLKSTLVLSNYLWLENNLPLELENNVIPDINTINRVDIVLNSSVLDLTNDVLENHPKLLELQTKKEILSINRRLQTNNLLPQIDLEYNFLTSDYNQINSLNTANYKSGLTISFPLFLRKERANIKLATLKIQNIDFDISATKVTLKNKITSVQQEIASYQTQYELLLTLVTDYKQLVKSEERKFNLGEGSLFLVNFREAKLIESQLKKIDAEYQLFSSKSTLIWVISSLE